MHPKGAPFGCSCLFSKLQKPTFAYCVVLVNHLNAFGVAIKGACRGLGGAVFTGQAEGLGAEGGVIAPTFSRLGAVFHDSLKIKTLFCPDLPDHSTHPYQRAVCSLK